jgi:cysteinyl-tRNA synthetase
MHNGFLQVEGEKMSKSLGNFVTIRDLLDGGWAGEVVRLAMLQTHYREPINWTATRLREAREELSLWVEIGIAKASAEFRHAIQIGGVQIVPDEGVAEALTNDLNTPMAIARLRELYSKALRGDSGSAAGLLISLTWLGIYRYQYYNAYNVHHLTGGVHPSFLKKYEKEILAARALVLNEYNRSRDYDQRKASLRNVNDKANRLNGEMRNDGVEIRIGEHCDVELQPTTESSKLDEIAIGSLIANRVAARAAKNWAESDRIRDELAAMGITLKDNKDGTTTWEVTR